MSNQNFSVAGVWTQQKYNNSSVMTESRVQLKKCSFLFMLMLILCLGSALHLDAPYTQAGRCKTTADQFDISKGYLHAMCVKLCVEIMGAVLPAMYVHEIMTESLIPAVTHSQLSGLRQHILVFNRH